MEACPVSAAATTPARTAARTRYRRTADLHTAGDTMKRTPGRWTALTVAAVTLGVAFVSGTFVSGTPVSGTPASGMPAGVRCRLLGAPARPR